ncbi:hypothetical protein ACFS07_25330 [Undibacterium arcticum]
MSLIGGPDCCEKYKIHIALSGVAAYISHQMQYLLYMFKKIKTGFMPRINISSADSPDSLGRRKQHWWGHPVLALGFRPFLPVGGGICRDRRPIMAGRLFRVDSGRTAH